MDVQSFYTIVVAPLCFGVALCLGAASLSCFASRLSCASLWGADQFRSSVYVVQDGCSG